MIFILLISTFTVFLIYELFWKRRGLPPGPAPFPIIGNLMSLARPKPGYEAFVKWRKEYGDVFTFWLARKPFIVITSYEIMKETFIKDGETYSDKVLNEGKGVLDSNGQMWREHRRFALSQLRDLGLGKDLMQEKILLEIEELQKQLDERLGEEINLPEFIDRSVANVINLALFNKRFETKQCDQFLYLKSLIDGMMNVVAEFKYFIQHLIPWTSWFIRPTLHEKSKEYREKLDEFFKEQVAEHRKEIDFDEVENMDYVEAYLKEQRIREADGDKETFSNDQLMSMIFDLYMAGLMTTTMTLTWGLAYYLHNPQVKARLQKELDEVIGSDRLIRTTDKNSLPYLSAFSNETQRCANIIPLNLLHKTTRDTVIGGWAVPKGTGVIAQIATVMMDEKVFQDPLLFNPDRFLEENGRTQKLKKIDEFLPFSLGKRQCLGEGLARMELFLLFANLFNRYDIEVENQGKLPSLDKSHDNFVMPRKFHAVLRKRH